MPMHDPARRRFLQTAAAATAGLALSPQARAAEDELPYGVVEVLDPDPQTGMSRAVVVGDVPLVHTEQLGYKELPSGVTIRETDDRQRLTDHLAVSIEELTAVLKAAGSSLGQVVKFNFYLAHAGGMEVVFAWLKKTYPGRYQPAVTFVVSRVGDLKLDFRITVDCVATRREPVQAAHVLRVDKAAVLPPMHKLYISGDAAQGILMPVVAQTLQSLEKCLEYCKLDWSHVVHLKTFLQPMILASDVRREMETYFGPRPMPPMSFVEWISSANVPMETELIATLPHEKGNQIGVTVEYLNPPHKPGNAVYSRIARVRSERTIYVSGLYGEPTDPDGQIHDIFKTLKQTVERAGGDLNHLVKATYYVTDDATSKRLGEIRPEYYDPKRPPAASKAKVIGTGREKKTITVDMIAVPKA